MYSCKTFFIYHKCSYCFDTPKQWLLLLITVVKVLLSLPQITTCGLLQIKKHFLVQTSNPCCYSKHSSIFYRFTAHFKEQHSPMFQCACNETSIKELLPFCSLFYNSSLRTRSLWIIVTSTRTQAKFSS